jgi:hypothetical protein
LQEELARMQPQLEEAVQESIVTMQQISEDTVSEYFHSFTGIIGKIVKI